MTEGENSEKRKHQPLTNSEWLTFFFLPFRRNRFDPNSLETFNEIEEERFKKFGFDKKLKESVSARRSGMVFYLALFIIIFYFINFN